MVRLATKKKVGGAGGPNGLKKKTLSVAGSRSSGGVGHVADARLALIKKNRTQFADARDKLVKMAKGQDARRKLEKIRNLKAGKVFFQKLLVSEI